MTPAPAETVRLMLTLLLVDAGWGTLWAALATTDWATPLRRWRDWPVGSITTTFPYAQPGSPGSRLAQWLYQLWSWGKNVLVPAAGPALGAAVTALSLSLVLAAALGSDMLILTVGGLALMQLALLQGRGGGQDGAGWDGVLKLGLPWLAGHLAFAPLTLPSTGLAAAFSVAAAGSAGGARGRALWAVGQLAAAALLLPLRRELAVPLLVLLLVPQILLSTQAGDHRRSWPWLAAGMLLTAWVL